MIQLHQINMLCETRLTIFWICSCLKGSYCSCQREPSCSIMIITDFFFLEKMRKTKKARGTLPLYSTCRRCSPSLPTVDGGTIRSNLLQMTTKNLTARHTSSTYAKFTIDDFMSDYLLTGKLWSSLKIGMKLGFANQHSIDVWTTNDAIKETRRFIVCKISSRLNILTCRAQIL